MMTRGAPSMAPNTGAQAQHSPRVALERGISRSEALSTAVLILVLALTGAGLVLLLGAPGQTADRFGHLPVQTAVRAVPCHTPAPNSAAGYARAFEVISGGWAGGDQASTAQLPDGRVLWIFGDTLQGTWTPEGTLIGACMVHNSFILQDAGCFVPVNGPDGREVIPDRSDGQWYWPQHALADGTRLWVLALRVAGSPSEGFAFSIRGMDLIEFTIVPRGLPRLVHVHRTPATDAGDFGVLWGTGLARDADTVYLYGTRRTDRSAWGKELLLAKVPLEQLSETGAWQFRTATGWSTDPNEVAVLHPANGGVSTALSAHRSTTGWVLVTKQDDFLGTDVIALTSADPWGPFRMSRLFTARSVGDELTYLPLAHPDLPLRDGSWLVTVNHNHMALSVVLSDRDAYRPTFTSVAGLG